MVAVCYVRLGDDLYVPIDAKPKTTRRLRRVRNLAENPRATFMVDHWDEDWRRLAWVQARGHGSLLAGAELAPIHAMLIEKYPQYAEVGLGDTAIRVAVSRWGCWRFDPGGD